MLDFNFYIQPFFGPHAVWYVSYQSLSRSWHTDLDYGSYRLSNVEIRLTAGVTGQQRMLNLPWHLIPPLIYSEVRIRSFSDLYFLYDLWDWLLIVIFVISLDIFEYCETKQKEWAVLLLDIQKVFDSVEWNFMFNTLEKSNFGEQFIKRMKILYINPIFRIRNSTRMSYISITFIFIVDMMS
jgi:hypothetical protein